jgi:hypothetical protein
LGVAGTCPGVTGVRGSGHHRSSLQSQGIGTRVAAVVEVGDVLTWEGGYGRQTEEELLASAREGRAPSCRDREAVQVVRVCICGRAAAVAWPVAGALEISPA